MFVSHGPNVNNNGDKLELMLVIFMLRSDDVESCCNADEVTNVMEIGDIWKYINLSMMMEWLADDFG